MKTLLSFNTLITPQFMKIFYYIGVVVCVLSGLGTFVGILAACRVGVPCEGVRL